MKEHPIIFSTAMVQAIQEGRKTQTRRIVREVNDLSNEDFGFTFRDIKYDRAIFDGMLPMVVKCPYGQRDDVLWVRESFCEGIDKYYFKADNHSAQPFTGWKPSIHMPRTAARIFLKVESILVERVQEITEDDVYAEGVKYPVTSVEGRSDVVSPLVNVFALKYMPKEKESWKEENYARAEFAMLWDTINGKRAHWESNPWVWVVNFSLIENYK